VIDCFAKEVVIFGAALCQHGASSLMECYLTIETKANRNPDQEVVDRLPPYLGSC
jgi:hypothetical protein